MWDRTFSYVCDEPSTVILQLPWSLLRFRPCHGVRHSFDQLGERDRRFGELTTPWRHLGLLDAKILPDGLDRYGNQYCMGKVGCRLLERDQGVKESCWHPMSSHVPITSTCLRCLWGWQPYHVSRWADDFAALGHSEPWSRGWRTMWHRVNKWTLNILSIYCQYAIPRYSATFWIDLKCSSNWPEPIHTDSRWFI